MSTAQLKPTNEHREHFEEFGYCIFKNAIPQNNLEAVRQSLHYLLSHGNEARQKMDLAELILDVEDEDHGKVYRAMKTMGSSIASANLLHALDISGKTTDLIDVPESRIHTTLFQTPIQIPKDTKFDFQWHQENGSYSKLPQITTFWFPILDPAREGHGTMEIIPGSHKKGVLPTEHIITEGGLNDWRVSLTSEEEAQGFAVEIDLGDVICFNADLVHKSSANKGERPRVTGIARTIDIGIIDEVVPLSEPINYNDDN